MAFICDQFIVAQLLFDRKTFRIKGLEKIHLQHKSILVYICRYSVLGVQRVTLLVCNGTSCVLSHFLRECAITIKAERFQDHFEEWFDT